MSREEIALWLITFQGFAVMYFEYDIWRMKRDDHVQRKKWREAKQRAILKKLGIELVPDPKPASGSSTPVDGAPTFARSLGLRAGRRVGQILRKFHVVLAK